MGEKWWPNGAWDMHPGFFYMPQIPSEGRRAEDFLKNPTASAGFESANLCIRGQHATSAPPMPLHYLLRSSCLSATALNRKERWHKQGLVYSNLSRN